MKVLLARVKALLRRKGIEDERRDVDQASNKGPYGGLRKVGGQIFLSKFHAIIS